MTNTTASLVERLQPRELNGITIADAVSQLSGNGVQAMAKKLAEWMIADNALRAEAAASLTELEAENGRLADERREALMQALSSDGQAAEALARAERAEAALKAANGGPAPGGVELGPDGKEWSKTSAGYDHVHAVLPHADGMISGAPYWFGWAIREAFVAGAEWQEGRSSQHMEPGP